MPPGVAAAFAPLPGMVHAPTVYVAGNACLAFIARRYVMVDRYLQPESAPVKG